MFPHNGYGPNILYSEGSTDGSTHARRWDSGKNAWVSVGKPMLYVVSRGSGRHRDRQSHLDIRRSDRQQRRANRQVGSEPPGRHGIELGAIGFPTRFAPGVAKSRTRTPRFSSWVTGRSRRLNGVRAAMAQNSNPHMITTHPADAVENCENCRPRPASPRPASRRAVRNERPHHEARRHRTSDNDATRARGRLRPRDR